MSRIPVQTKPLDHYPGDSVAFFAEHPHSLVGLMNLVRNNLDDVGGTIYVPKLCVKLLVSDAVGSNMTVYSESESVYDCALTSGPAALRWYCWFRDKNRSLFVSDIQSLLYVLIFKNNITRFMQIELC